MPINPSSIMLIHYRVVVSLQSIPGNKWLKESERGVSLSQGTQSHEYGQFKDFSSTNNITVALILICLSVFTKIRGE